VGGIVEVERVRHDLVIAAGLQGNPDGAIDGDREHEAVIVVGMLADQGDAARGANDERGRVVEAVLKALISSLSESES
jgi:hypothetical protein